MFPVGTPSSRFIWDYDVGRYYNTITGKYVSPSVVKKSLERVIKSTERKMEQITKSLIKEQIDLKTWQLQMMEQIKLSHLASAFVGKGGWQQMNAKDFRYTNSIIKQQYKYLTKFAKQIKKGKQPLGGNIFQRVSLYAQASRAHYEEMQRRHFMEIGMNEERKVLGVADRCPGCLKQASKGWCKIGTLDPIGSQECVTNCHCVFEFRYNPKRKK